MQIMTEWRYYRLTWKVVLVLYLAAYCVAASTHLLDLLTMGMYRVEGIPNWINYFWLALTFADPFAVLALLCSVPAGIAVMLVIIYADVAINAYVSLSLAGPAALLSFFFLCQAGFLLFISATLTPLLKSVDRCVIAESDRLYLRPLRMSDKKELARILTDPVSMQWYPRPYTLRETGRWIRRNRKRYRRDGFGLWAMILKEGGRFAGEAGVTLQKIDGETLPEIGYHTLSEYRGLGIAPEGAALALEYCQKRFSLAHIYSYCEAGNDPSRRVMEKLGLKMWKAYSDNGTEKTVYHRVLSDDFLIR